MLSTAKRISEQIGSDAESLRLLLVSTSWSRLALLERLLAVYGHQVVYANGLGQATKALKQENFHLALVDLDMAEFDGLTLIGHLWREDPDLPILAVGAQNDDIRREAAIQAGVSAHFNWPPDPPALAMAAQVAAKQGISRPYAMARKLMATSNAVAMESAKHNEAERFLLRSLNLLMEHFAADRGTMFLAEKDATGAVLLQPRAADGINPDFLSAVKPGEKVTGKVFSTGLGQLILNEVSSQPGYENCRAISGLSAGMSVPMRVQDEIRGVVNISMTQTNKPFTPRDLEMLEFLAGNVALSLEHVEVVSGQTVLRKQLENAERLSVVGELTASITHEIKNPLAFVQTNLGTLKEYMAAVVPLLQDLQKQSDSAAFDADIKKQILADDIDDVVEDAVPLISECQEGITRCRTIIEDLRSMMQSDEAELDFADVSLSDALEQGKKMTRSKVAKVAQVLSTMPDDVQVYGGEIQIVQMFINLLNNAADAIAERLESQPEPVGEIQVSAELQERAVKVSVGDNGIGMDAQTLSRVFNPLFTTKQKRGGIGLGLGMVQRIAARHGGEIQIVSEKGQGTTVSVILPRALGED